MDKVGKILIKLYFSQNPGNGMILNFKNSKGFKLKFGGRTCGSTDLKPFSTVKNYLLFAGLDALSLV